jgi:uncharacterized damage-inducible protein DinB
MHVSADALRSHLEYSAWASTRLMDAASKLAPDELTRDFGTADKSVIGTLVHVFGADRIWLARVRGEGAGEFPGPLYHDLAVIRSEWPAVHQAWREWADRLTDDQCMQELAYRDMAGNPWTNPVSGVVLHVVNHATHHRGQVSGFLRMMGHLPPKLDLIAYYRGVA